MRVYPPRHPNEYPLVFLFKGKQYPFVLGPTGNSTFAPELRDFSQLEPVDSAPMAAVEVQEFFHALQVWGAVSVRRQQQRIALQHARDVAEHAYNMRCVQATCK